MPRWLIGLVVLAMVLLVAWLTRARWAPLLVPAAPQPDLPAGGTAVVPATPAAPPLQDNDPPPTIRRMSGALQGALGAR